MQDAGHWCSCKDHDACKMLAVGASAKIMMHAQHGCLMLLQRSQCMQDADCWCSCKNHDACRVLTVGAPEKIMMHALPCRALTIGAPEKIMMHAGC